MKFGLFGPEWAQEWRRRIEGGSFGNSGRDWRESLALSVKDADEPCAVGISVQGGRCTSVESLDARGLDDASVVIEADAASWEDVLTGRLDPLFAMLQGRLVVSKGDTTALMPYAAAAKDLLAAAGEVPTDFSI